MIIELQKKFPLQICDCIFMDHQIALEGINWKFKTESVWRILAPNRLIAGCYDENNEKSFLSLKGQSIIKITVQSALVPVDPIFHLSNGSMLAIFSTTSTHSWSFQYGSGPVYIGSPTNPEAIPV